MSKKQHYKTEKSSAVILDAREKVKLKRNPPNFSQFTFTVDHSNAKGKINSD